MGKKERFGKNKTTLKNDRILYFDDNTIYSVSMIDIEMEYKDDVVTGVEDTKFIKHPTKRLVFDRLNIHKCHYRDYYEMNGTSIKRKELKWLIDHLQLLHDIKDIN